MYLIHANKNSTGWRPYDKLPAPLINFFLTLVRYQIFYITLHYIPGQQQSVQQNPALLGNQMPVNVLQQVLCVQIYETWLANLKNQINTHSDVNTFYNTYLKLFIINFKQKNEK